MMDLEVIGCLALRSRPSSGGAPLRSVLRVLVALLSPCRLMSAQEKPAGDSGVTRATLDNGLRVVIIRDPLAPVVTVEQNYLVGGNETPAGFPGMAHAQEHMAFRGCSELSADQISAISFAQLGGYGNADTPAKHYPILFHRFLPPMADIALPSRFGLYTRPSRIHRPNGPRRSQPSSRKWPRICRIPTYKFYYPA